MNAGIEIFNSDNHIVVNDTFNNLGLKRKVKLVDLPVPKDSTVYLNVLWDGKCDHYGVELTLGDNEKLFGFSCKNSEMENMGGFFTIQRMEENRYVFTWRDKNPFTSTDVDLSDVYVYVFGTETTEQSNFGLQVFNGKNCIFDSGRKYIRVVGQNKNIGTESDLRYAYCPYAFPMTRINVSHDSFVGDVYRGMWGYSYMNQGKWKTGAIHGCVFSNFFGNSSVGLAEYENFGWLTINVENL